MTDRQHGYGEVGVMLMRAMQQKSEALGKRYTYRELDRDSGVDFTHAIKIANGQRRASATVIRALARALTPYLPLDEALLAAGHAPDTMPGGLAADAIPLRLRVPVYEDFPVHAGEGGIPIQITYIDAMPGRKEGEIIGLLVKGDCMSGVIEEGEVIVIDKLGEVDDGDAVVIDLGDDWVVRRCWLQDGAYVFTCDNSEAHDDRALPETPERMYPVINVQKGRPRLRRR